MSTGHGGVVETVRGDWGQAEKGGVGGGGPHVLTMQGWLLC